MRELEHLQVGNLRRLASVLVKDIWSETRGSAFCLGDLAWLG